ncbi:MAG: DarT ssDNA thymidine ADP-ribosyltransferase family protein [bacterium]|nr:DarT ssDNA thymidine ADP-ribosyltransferase family protein [bacterium]
MLKKIKEIFSRHNIKVFYHFTDINNLPIIGKCNGLWSKEKLEEHGFLSDIVTGGNELSLNLDKELENWNKVHLYFCPNTPMVYNKQKESHSCYFIIKPDVAFEQGVFFTNTNATRKRNGHKRDHGLEGLKLVDFDTIKSTLETGPKPWDKTWHRNVQAECLIPQEVSIDKILSINFISEASLEEGNRLWRNNLHPPFKVDNNLFYAGFPVVNSAILTSSDISKDNVKSKHFEHEDTFVSGQKITFLVNVQATPGLEANIKWFLENRDIINESTTVFENQSNYWHWTSIDSANLNSGRYNVEYYLGNTRWIRITFIIYDF